MPLSIIYAISAMFLFGTAVFFYKLGTPNFSPGIGAAIFIASHLIPLGLFLIFEKTKFDTTNVKFLILGGIIAGLAQITFFLALKEGKINTVVPILLLSL